jgi:hypothetical protein
MGNLRYIVNASVNATVYLQCNNDAMIKITQEMKRKTLQLKLWTYKGSLETIVNNYLPTI